MGHGLKAPRGGAAGSTGWTRPVARGGERKMTLGRGATPRGAVLRRDDGAQALERLRVELADA